MISDEDLKWFASAHKGGGVGEMATELLAHREAERLHLQCWIKDFAEDAGCSF